MCCICSLKPWLVCPFRFLRAAERLLHSAGRQCEQFTSLGYLGFCGYRRISLLVSHLSDRCYQVVHAVRWAWSIKASLQWLHRLRPQTVFEWRRLAAIVSRFYTVLDACYSGQYYHVVYRWSLPTGSWSLSVISKLWDAHRGTVYRPSALRFLRPEMGVLARLECRIWFFAQSFSFQSPHYSQNMIRWPIGLLVSACVYFIPFGELVATK